MNILETTSSRLDSSAHDQHVAVYPARDKRTFLYAFSLLLDILSMFGGYAFALLVRDPQWLESGNQALIVVALPIFIMFEIARGAQSVETLENRLLGIQRSLGALIASVLVVIGLTFLFGAGEVSRLGFVVTFAATAVLVVISKFIVDWIFKKTMNGIAIATILLIDGLEAAPEIGIDVFDAGEAGLWPDLDHPEMIDALSRVIATYDRVIIACRFEHRAAWSTFLKGHDIGGEILLDRDLLHGAVGIGEYADHDTIIISHGPLNLFNRLQKRALDLVVALFALIVLSPLLVIVAFAIKMDSPGPILFRQMRVGQGNRQFRIFKFRSMRIENSDAKGNRSTGREDDRVTRVGRLIRRTSIDELPQLFNVLRGEMSMVGPRPHALGSLAGDALFWRVSNHYWLRHALKPGITGLAQIRGFRGSTDQKEDLEKRLRCDLEYLSNWSIGLDTMILIKTLPVVIHKNAF
ncbi:MAG: exopolysaccharide biosynthesis polyprenyl glycosylphosphotransferase [Parasphingorhabdus sp.]|uniref:exopolysaccharide biosynthesis polyprenyl glycosylphosphotransferase n=1 Tax=Parasphingorhabdus sp. TaxID=2709688 RepID=UPI0030016BCE